MPEPDADYGPLARVRLDLAYDGSGFSGWGRQPGLRTVQGELETALGVVLRQPADPPRLTVAGRTDAGVHALGQVAHLDLDTAQLAALDRPRRARQRDEGGSQAADRSAPGSIAARLNGIAGLSADLYVARAAFAPPGFDARFSAIWRRYEYRIADVAAVHDPLRRASTLWHPAALDPGAMVTASRSMLGLHDFAAFCKPREGATTVRTLLEFDWRRDPDGVLVAHLRADAFCHSMVRALVGAAVAVGAGRLPPERMPELLAEGRRSSEFIVMPAKGLTLMEVGYPPDAELAARAEQTRARRDDPAPEV